MYQSFQTNHSRNTTYSSVFIPYTENKHESMLKNVEPFKKTDVNLIKNETTELNLKR